MGASDGSRVVGAPVAKARSPDGQGVDWLLVKTRSATGPGLFARVGYVRRLATHGGQAPAAGCSAATAGHAASIPYTAVYEFYRPGP